MQAEGGRLLEGARRPRGAPGHWWEGCGDGQRSPCAGDGGSGDGGVAAAVLALSM